MLSSMLASGAVGEATTAPMARLPLVLIPAFLMPLFVMRHAAALTAIAIAFTVQFK